MPAERPDADLLQRMTYLELKQRLAELLLMRVDKMLDGDLRRGPRAVPRPPPRRVRARVAATLKVRDGVGKVLLKQAVDGLLPHDLVYRKKMGFGAPVSEWFRSDLGVRAQHDIRNSSLAERGLIDYDLVDELWDGAPKRPGVELPALEPLQRLRLARLLGRRAFTG